MGRHSIPDSGDPADDGNPGGDDPGHRPEPDPPVRRRPEYRRPDFLQPDDERSYRDPAAGAPAGYRRAGYHRPEYSEPVYDDEHPGYESEYESDYPEDDFTDDFTDDDFTDEQSDPGDGDAPTSQFRRSPPPPAGPAGPAHGGDWDGGDWTGSHRAITAGRRGVSVSVIAALITVVVVVGVFILWQFFGDALSNRSDAAAARCVDGELAVSVLADPSIADQIGALATKYNETASPVGDRCVKVGVRPAESDTAISGFTGKWPTDLGERPALWIPASGVSEARLEAVTGKESVSDSRSLVTSPVLIATRPQLNTALARQTWGTLPALQSNPTALDGLSLQGWGSLRLSLPMSGDADASYLAAEAVAVASAPAGAPASSGIGAVSTLMAGQPKLADTSASAAWDALLKAGDPASAPVHAIVTTEQQLFQRGAALADAKSTVTSFMPPGPAPIADYPTVLLSGNWLSSEQVTAASEFARFMRKPEQLTELAKAGFRTEGGNPPASDVTTFAPVPAPLSVGDNGMRVTLADALDAPVGNPAVTIMLDQSMSAEEGDKSRLSNVATALNARLQALSPASSVGLWTFDGAEGRPEVAAGPLSDPIDGRPRSAAIAAALDGQAAAGGGAVSFTTLRMLYTEAVSNFRQGQSNSVLVITTGPHTDQSLDGQGLQDFVRGAFDPAKPVAINVIDFGSDSDRSTWEAVAQTSGGAYQNLSTSASQELTSAIAGFLS